MPVQTLLLAGWQSGPAAANLSHEAALSAASLHLILKFDVGLFLLRSGCLECVAQGVSSDSGRGHLRVFS